MRRAMGRGEGEATLIFGGDTTPVYRGSKAMELGPDIFWPQIAALFREHDLALVNLESPLVSTLTDAPMKSGPVLMLTVWPNGPSKMGMSMVLWFLYTAVVGLFAAYIAGRALPIGAPYLHVFRFVGATAFIGYCLALWQMSIWYRRAWGTTIKATVDGLIYALLTAGTFGWLWPR